MPNHMPVIMSTSVTISKQMGQDMQQNHTIAALIQLILDMIARLDRCSRLFLVVSQSQSTRCCTMAHPWSCSS